MLTSRGPRRFWPRASAFLYFGAVWLSPPNAFAQSATEREAIAAAKIFFGKLDGGDAAGAYRQMSETAKALVSFEIWLPGSGANDPVASRNFTRTVVYPQPDGQKTVVEFNGTSKADQWECGYVVIDAGRSVARLEQTRIPLEALKNSRPDQLAELAALPGCAPDTWPR